MIAGYCLIIGLLFPVFPTYTLVSLEATAYTSGYESTQKHPDHPAYGITASGAEVEQGVTVAAGPSLPFGTRIYAPRMEKWLGSKWFQVQDRGGAISDKHIDFYFEDLKEALEFGRRNVSVWIVVDPL